MRIPRVYVPQALNSGAVVHLDSNAAHHIVTVLRLKPGAPLLLFNGEGGEYEATLQGIERKGASTVVGAPLKHDREPLLRLTLAQGMARGERMDYCVQKAVELGVARFVPLQTERSVVQLQGKRLEKRRQHWQGVAIGACEQSGRTRIPEIAPITMLGDWLSETRSEPCLILDPQGIQSLRDLPAPGQAISVLVGPEGGFSREEIGQATAHGCTPIRFGPRILRSETAGIAMLAALQTLWGDL